MALQRCFSLPPYKLDIHEWFDAAPKPRRRVNFWPTKPQKTIAGYFGASSCARCGLPCASKGRAKVVVCPACGLGEPLREGAAWALGRAAKAARMRDALRRTCESCSGCRGSAEEAAFAAERGGGGRGEGVVVPFANCLNMECDVLYRRHRVREMELESEAVCGAFGLFDI